MQHLLLTKSFVKNWRGIYQNVPSVGWVENLINFRILIFFMFFSCFFVKWLYWLLFSNECRWIRQKKWNPFWNDILKYDWSKKASFGLKQTLSTFSLFSAINATQFKNGFFIENQQQPTRDKINRSLPVFPFLRKMGGVGLEKKLFLTQ